MKKILVILTLIILAGVGLSAAEQAAAPSDGYTIKYEWPKKPKVGGYTLKVTVFDKAGKQLKDVKVIASYDMPSMRGHHAASEEMKLSKKVDFLLPIHFAMRGQWEIILSAQKNGKEIASETILLYI